MIISTKLTVDQYDSFNLLTEYLFKTGAIKNATPSGLLRHNITKLLNSYHDDIENYRITKLARQSDNGHQVIISNTKENKQEEGSTSLAPPDTTTSSEESSLTTSDQLQKQEEKHTKEKDDEFEKLWKELILDILISPYTAKDKEKEQKERIPISPHLAKLVHTAVQELGNEIMPAADAFDRLYVAAKKENFPIDAIIKDREKLKKFLGIDEYN